MKVIIFGGTSEGRMLSECLCRNKIAHTLCVATDYGEEVLEPSEYAHVLQGRLDTQQMADLIQSEQCLVVVDATHPYAVEVSKNIRKACEMTEMKYLRFLRAEEAVIDVKNDVIVSSAAEAAAYLDGQEGAIFLTTGSKELPAFTAGVHETERLFVRVLPSVQVVASCRELGLEGKQICAMQGPFSEEMNRALLQQTKASWLVTKDTGITGGFPEKVRAARSLGVRLVIIRRPEESGLDYESVLQALEPVLKQKIEGNFARILEKRTISCIGIGMGTLDTLTHEAAETIRNADILFGAKRILESVEHMPGLLHESQERVEEYRSAQIAEYLSTRPHLTRIVILMSGDVGFYSGARLVQDAFPDEKDRLLLWNFFRCVFCLEGTDFMAGCEAAQCTWTQPQLAQLCAALSKDHYDRQRRRGRACNLSGACGGRDDIRARDGRDKSVLSGRNGHIRYAGSLSAGGDDRTSYHAD